MRRSRARCTGLLLGALLGCGIVLGIAPAQAATGDARCTVGPVTYRILLPTLVREGPRDACARVADARVLDAVTVRPLVVAEALVAVPPASGAPAAPSATPVPTPTPSPSPSPSSPEPPSATASPTPSAPPSPAGPPAAAAPSPTAAVVVPPPAVPLPTGPLPAASPAVAVLPGPTGPRPGVNLLAPDGAGATVDPDAPLGTSLDPLLTAPGQAPAPETVVLRTLGETDPTGVHSATTAEALAAQRRPGTASAALGAAILATLGGLAVRHRTLRRRAPAAPGRPAGTPAPRLVTMSVRSRPGAIGR